MEEAERHANHLVQLIRELVDTLRNFNDLSSVRQQRRPQEQQQRQKQQSDVVSDDELAYEIQTLTKVFHKLADKIKQLSTEINQSIVDPTDTWNESYYLLVGRSFASGGNVWDFIVFNLLHPLLNCLGRCYQVLDDYQQTNDIKEHATTAPNEASDEKTSNHECPNSINQHRQGPGRRRPVGPRPPPGMLSIQNYTDVAVLLEFMVCISLLPHWDANVRPSLTNRLQSLPRSLRGRAPLWAMRYGAYQRVRPNQNSDCVKKKEEDIQTRRYELLSTATLVGNLVLLERFRPILLPRHLADIYAALLQAEHLYQTIKMHENNVDGPILMPASEKLQSALLQTNPSGFISAHPSQAARAFQDLLLHGKKGPLWLRKRVSSLLNHLVTTRLESVIEVFVFSTPDDMTASAQRLARALTLKTNKDGAGEHLDYFVHLSNQVLTVLDRFIFPSTDRNPSMQQKYEVATIYFLWMTIDQLPDSVVQTTLFTSLARSFECGGSERSEKKEGGHPFPLHHTVRMIEKFLSTVPPGVNKARFCRLVLLRPLKNLLSGVEAQGADTTILALLIRLSCAPAILQNEAKLDALRALRVTTEFISTSNFLSVQGGTPVEGIHVAVVSMFYALVPTKWDLAPTRFRFPSQDRSDDDSPFCAVFTYIDKSEPDVDTVVADIQRCAEHIFQEIVLSLWVDRENTEKANASKLSSIPSLMLEFLLVVHLRSFGSEDADSARKSQQLLLLTAMVATPVLCEICPMDSLISCANGQLKLLSLMRTVFEGLSSFHNDIYDPSTISTVTTTTSQRSLGTFSAAETIASKFFDESVEDISPPVMSNEPASAFATSLAMVLLNILACILELGAFKRSKEEEDEILDLTPSLEAVAGVDLTRRKAGIDSGEWAEIGEAASHVLSLIAVRKGGGESGGGESQINIRFDDDHNMSVDDRLTSARRDMISAEAPFRARGIASIRQIICASKKELNEQENTQHITVVDESEDEEHVLRMEDMFLLLVEALADSESYVYLAAIHTLVLMSSSPPFFSVIMRGIATGSLVLSGQRKTLLLHQRVKLTEVSIMVLRRFPSVLHNHAAMVFDVLLYGRNPEVSIKHNQAGEILRRTLDFFEGGEEKQRSDEIDDWEEKTLRLNTGGPIFEVEEPDLVRSALISLVSETVVLAHPSISARYCAGMMDCSMKCLSLHSARPIVRTGALLAYCLYSVVVREMEEIQIPGALESSVMIQCPMTMAMVKSGEEVLANMLRRCAAGLGADAPACVLSDPATVARCEEALAMRERAESGGMLAVGQMALERASRDNTFLVQLLASR